MARYYSGLNQPLGHWNERPIYLTTILTGVLIFGLVLSAVLMSMHSPLLSLFTFTMPLLPAWTLWRLFTYVIIGYVSFFTPFSIFFFYLLSIGLETHLGRPKLVKLLVLLTLVPPAIAAVAYWGFGIFAGLSDNNLLMSGLLVAFATLYPNTEAEGWVPFKWIAFACIACGSLMMLADRNWLSLIALWSSCAAAYAYISHAKETEYDDYESPIERFKFWMKRRKFKVVKAPNGGVPTRSAMSREVDESEEMDRLLDKISQGGMASLTAKEKAQLEKARAALLKKDQR